MEQRKKLFFLIAILVFIVFVSTPLIFLLVKAKGASFFLRSILALLAIYIVLEIISLLGLGKK